MNEIIENINLAKDIVKQNIEKQQEKSKERFDQKTKIPDFKLFDKVLIKSHKVSVGLSPKLVEKYHGPYYISEIGPNFTYKIRDCKYRKEVKSFMNAVQLKHYNDPEVDRQHLNENTCTGTQNDKQPQNDVQDENLRQIQNDENQTQSSSTDEETEDEADHFPFDIKRLVKYRHKDQHFCIEWTDGTKYWEPQENVRPDLVQQYFEKYTKKGRVRKK